MIILAESCAASSTASAAQKAQKKAAYPSWNRDICTISPRYTICGPPKTHWYCDGENNCCTSPKYVAKLPAAARPLGAICATGSCHRSASACRQATEVARSGLSTEHWPGLRRDYHGLGGNLSSQSSTLRTTSSAVRSLLVARSKMPNGPPEAALDTRSSIRQVCGPRSKLLEPNGPICLVRAYLTTNVKAPSTRAAAKAE
jgi:hypothetical protein